MESAETLLELDRLVYGLTFHPDYVRNGYLFVVSNSLDKDKQKLERISRFTIGHAAAPFAP